MTTVAKNAPSIYILASERSGTNLLRSLLSNHSCYEGPIPVHFFDTFYHVASQYGDLHEQHNMRALLDDAVALANHPYHAWMLQADVTSLLEKYQPTSLFSAFQALYGAWCGQQGKPAMVCKDNNLFNYAFYIKANDPQACFVYLYRDVRAYCASWKDVPAMHKTTYQNARQWAAEQTVCLNLMAVHGIDCVPVAYESLVSDTPATMDRILAHAGVAAEPGCYQTAVGKNDEAAARNEFWKNINQPVFNRGADGYRKKLSGNEIAMIETVAGPVMQRLGYKPEAAEPWKKPRWFSLQEKLHKKQLKRAVFNGGELLQSKTDLVRQIQHGKRHTREKAKAQ